MSLKAPLVAATGATGLVGRGLTAADPAVVPLGREADITNPAAFSRALETIAAAAGGRPVVVIHLAALTDTKSGDQDTFERVNVAGTENVMRAARELGTGFIHVSTDYVFSGETAGAPFQEADRPSTPPAGVYALSKFRAENRVLDAGLPRAAVARIAFPYGGPGPRPGLAEKMALRFADARKAGKPVPLFNDQFICPSYVPDVARGLLGLAALLGRGDLPARVFHLTGEPTTPWEFGGLVRAAFGFEDVAVAAGSVKGTPYAADLRLSTEATRASLDWRPTPHEGAIKKV